MEFLLCHVCNSILQQVGQEEEEEEEDMLLEEDKLLEEGYGGDQDQNEVIDISHEEEEEEEEDEGQIEGLNDTVSSSSSTSSFKKVVIPIINPPELSEEEWRFRCYCDQRVNSSDPLEKHPFGEQFQCSRCGFWCHVACMLGLDVKMEELGDATHCFYCSFLSYPDQYHLNQPISHPPLGSKSIQPSNDPSQSILIPRSATKTKRRQSHHTSIIEDSKTKKPRRVSTLSISGQKVHTTRHLKAKK